MKQTTTSYQAGKFKAECLKLMDEVKEKHISITITKHGKPIAKLVPIEEEPQASFGCLKGTLTINADIITPINAEWEAGR